MEARKNKGRDRGRGRRQDSELESEFIEEVIHINRVSKVVKGGRKFHFTALVAMGDKRDRVGLGYGKAGEVVDAIKKGVDDAKRNMVTVYREGTTIPYEVISEYCASKIILRPAAKGHGIIAGGPARPIIALSGIEDVTAKFIGSTNAINTARACFNALKMIETPDRISRLRSGEKVDSAGRFIAEVRQEEAQQAIADFTAEEQAAQLADPPKPKPKPKAKDGSKPVVDPKPEMPIAEVASKPVEDKQPKKPIAEAASGPAEDTKPEQPIAAGAPEPADAAPKPGEGTKPEPLIAEVAQEPAENKQTELPIAEATPKPDAEASSADSAEGKE